MSILIFCLPDMLHHLGIQIEDQFFSYICAMVAETFHLADHASHVKTYQGTSRMFLYIVGNDLCRVMVDLVDQVIFDENA